MSTHQDSVRTSANHLTSVATGEKITLDGAAAGVYFETDQALGDTPTLMMNVTDSIGTPVRKFLLEEVCYFMNPTAAETYQLYLLEDASADNVQQYTDLVFWSPAAQADSVCYTYRNSGYAATITTAEVAQYKLPRLVELATPGKLYFMLDWSGAPGVTPGFIKIRGRFLK